ncbi:MAG TPA: YhjD/YihY/BrkB family envelope integrity protein [Gaiellaceae bacterium]
MQEEQPEPPPVTNGEQTRGQALAVRAEVWRQRASHLPGAPLVLEVLETERRLGGVLIEAGVAFRFFLWLVPFGLVGAAFLSFWDELDPGALEHEARRFGLTAAAAHAGARALENGSRGIVLVLVFGIAMLFWFSLGAIRALVLAFSLAWGTPRRRLRRPLHAIALFNGLFLVAFAASSGVAWLRERIGAEALLGSLLSAALMIVIALVAMWFLPHGDAHLRDLVPGAVLVGVGYQLITVAVLFYFAPRLGRAEETYGAFGTAATMLVWLYVLARLVIGSAFLNAVLYNRRSAA